MSEPNLVDSRTLNIKLAKRSIWQQIIKFNDEHFPDWRTRSPVYLSNALSGEGGELLELLIVKIGKVSNLVKHLIGGGTKKTEVTREDVIEELIDIDIYKTLLSEVLGFDEMRYQVEFEKKMMENKLRMAENVRLSKGVRTIESMHCLGCDVALQAIEHDNSRLDNKLICPVCKFYTHISDQAIRFFDSLHNGTVKVVPEVLRCMECGELSTTRLDVLIYHYAEKHYVKVV